MKRWMTETLMGLFLLFFVFLVSRHAGTIVSGVSVSAEKEKPVVVIDSGHPAFATGQKKHWMKRSFAALTL